MRIPVYILTGFLGSGKTTVLKKCLAEARFGDTAVLINEFGEIGLDHLLVESVDEEITVLESGCVCCNVRDDFSAALLALANRRDTSTLFFNRVVLETTGIANPNSIHQLLMTDPKIRSRYYHGGTVTVVDGKFGLDTLATHPEAILQVALANRLIISKFDIASVEEITGIKKQLAVVNPSASVRECTGLVQALDEFGGEADNSPPLASQNSEISSTGDEHLQRFRSFQISPVAPLKAKDLRDWLEALLFARGDDILRIKGWANVANEPLPVVIQSVQHALYPQEKLNHWPGGQRSTQLTFICREFTRSAAMRSLREICQDNTREIDDEDLCWPVAGTGSTGKSIIAVALPQLAGQAHSLLKPALETADRRPWHSWALHNPWSLAATVVDSWSILSICQNRELLDAVEQLIGSDIILAETQLRAINARKEGHWDNDAIFFPVESVDGAAVRLPLKPSSGLRFLCRAPPTFEFSMDAGAQQFIVHAAALNYRYEVVVDDERQFELVMLFYSADGRYSRDPTHPVHQALMERFPLRQSVKAPLWLVRGEDRAGNDFVSGFQVKSAYWAA